MWQGKTDIQWMKIFLDWVERYRHYHPTNSGQYRDYSQNLHDFLPNVVPMKIRKDIVYYSRGHGWRLHKNWKEVLENRKRSFGHDK